MTLDLDFVRSQFPGLRDDEVYFDNAGGSLALGRVADLVHEYLTHKNVQLGASYRQSAESAAEYHGARARMAGFVGAAQPEEIVFGPSSTILLKFLAKAMAGSTQAGDEIVVTRLDHEANIGPWLELAEHRRADVRFWEPDPTTGDLELTGLEAVLSDRTRIVAMTHVSNILGSIHDVAAVAERVHRYDAELCVDGVAFAPHRQLEVAAWDVDYYVFSLYKVYGPHHAVLYGKHDALLALDNINHTFFTRDQVPGKLEPGNANYELSVGATGIDDYFDELGTRMGHADRQAVFTAIAAHEARLAEPLLALLRSRDDVTIHGHPDADPAHRVPTVSFSHTSRPSQEIVEAVDAHGIGIRFGHFYAARLIDHLGLADRGGVVRTSMVHYNTETEVGRLVQVLAGILG